MPAPIGNRNAAKGRYWAKVLRETLYDFTENNIEKGTAIKVIAANVVRMAIEGDQWAITEIGNRLDGKPAVAIVGGDEDDNPISFREIVIRAIDATGDRSTSQGG